MNDCVRRRIIIAIDLFELVLLVDGFRYDNQNNDMMIDALVQRLSSNDYLIDGQVWKDAKTIYLVNLPFLAVSRIGFCERKKSSSAHLICKRKIIHQRNDLSLLITKIDLWLLVFSCWLRYILMSFRDDAVDVFSFPAVKIDLEWFVLTVCLFSIIFCMLQWRIFPQKYRLKIVQWYFRIQCSLLLLLCRPNQIEIMSRRISVELASLIRSCMICFELRMVITTKCVIGNRGVWLHLIIIESVVENVKKKVRGKKALFFWIILLSMIHWH